VAELHHFVLHLVERAGYAGLLLVMIAGNLALPVGTEIILPVVGVLVATGHLPSLWLTVLIAVIGELIGGSLLFAIGKYGGPPFVRHFGRFVHLREHEMERVHGFYQRFGSKTVFLSRFIPVIRGIAALPAGLSDMPWPAFLLYTAAGSAIFCSVLIALGSRLGRHLHDVLPL
jgi:membrane protein DedA with SNARE-associated domain